MISRLRGTPAGRTADGLVLDVGGVGYLVAATPSALRRAADVPEVTIETYLHVREDALQLYGFADAAERELFIHLLGVSGIGPKVALAVVSSAPPADLRRAIALKDPARFQAIPGIGKKTAERIVLELEEKLGSEDVAALQALPAVPTSAHGVARDALVELGYSVVEAEQALARTDPDLPAEERVRRPAERRMSSQFLAPVLQEGDEAVEQSLRPRRLDDFVGQERTKEQLEIALEAARGRGDALDHVLLVGPPGLGKTTLATIIREELGVGIRTVAGPALERKGDMAAILTGSTLVTSSSSTRSIASTGRSRRSCTPALEDFRLDIIVGQERAPAR